MPFLTVNPDNSIEDITETDETGAGAEIDASQLDEINRNRFGHSVFKYIGGVIVFDQLMMDDRLFPLIKDAKITELKASAVMLMRAKVAVSNFDEVELTREIWLSIAPAARAATVNFQYIIDVFQAGKDAAAVINTYTTAAEVDAYNVTTGPAWPAP